MKRELSLTEDKFEFEPLEKPGYPRCPRCKMQRNVKVRPKCPICAYRDLVGNPNKKPVREEALR